MSIRLLYYALRAIFSPIHRSVPIPSTSRRSSSRLSLRSRPTSRLSPTLRPSRPQPSPSLGQPQAPYQRRAIEAIHSCHRGMTQLYAADPPAAALRPAAAAAPAAARAAGRPAAGPARAGRAAAAASCRPAPPPGGRSVGRAAPAPRTAPPGDGRRPVPSSGAARRTAETAAETRARCGSQTYRQGCRYMISSHHCSQTQTRAQTNIDKTIETQTGGADTYTTNYNGVDAECDTIRECRITNGGY